MLLYANKNVIKIKILDMEQAINAAYDSGEITQEILPIIAKIIEQIDSGALHVCEQIDGMWVTKNWLRKAILLYFKTTQSSMMNGHSFDKVPSKFTTWDRQNFIDNKLRVVPGAHVRYGCHLEPGVIVMPAFINVGAYVSSGTMVDSNVTIGSCAHIGKGCHIGAGTTIGGSLEPFTLGAVVIEDDVFIGANCSITEGVIVEKGAVIASGVHISGATKIYDTTTDMLLPSGKIPQNAVVVSGTLPRGKVAVSCAIIIKYADEKTRKNTALNDMFRD